MSVIQVDSTAIRSQAKQLKTCRETHIRTIQNLRKLILSLNEDWKGEAQDAFTAKFLSMNMKFKQFDQILLDYARLMQKVADEMEKTDQEMRTMIQRID